MGNLRNETHLLKDIPEIKIDEVVELTIGQLGKAGWTIRLRNEKITEEDLERLNRINDWLLKKYSGNVKKTGDSLMVDADG